MRHESRNRTFPVGLYATLLVGLFGVTFPGLLAPVETAARTLVSLPLRAYSILLDAAPVLAATTDPGMPGAVEGQFQSVMRGAVGPAGHTPRVCGVVDRRVGPLGVVDELVLDCTQGELAGCAPLVTAGTGLLGFRFVPPVLDATTAAEPARVRLLAYRRRGKKVDRLRVQPTFRPARVSAKVECRELGAQGVLRFQVEPARAIDRWSLRCTLLDDSYLGSQLRHSGDPVITLGGEDGLLPPGLQVGRLMIWGYPELDIPIGLFVAPVRDPRGISSVVVWEAADGGGIPPQPERGGSLLPVRFTRFPAPRPVFERWMVTSAASVTLPDGAALVDQGRLLGLLQRPWSGQSLVMPFAASTRTWALLLRTGDGVVQEVVGRLAGRTAAGRLRLTVLAPAGLAVGGELWTGANGPHCPAGLLIGTAEPAEAETTTFPTSAAGRPDTFSALPGTTELWLRLPETAVVAPQVFRGPGTNEEVGR